MLARLGQVGTMFLLLMHIAWFGIEAKLHDPSQPKEYWEVEEDTAIVSSVIPAPARLGITVRGSGRVVI